MSGSKASRGDHGPVKIKDGAVDLNPGRARKTCLSQIYVDAQVLETVDGVVVADMGSKPAHARHGLDEVHDGGRVQKDTEIFPGAEIIGGPRRSDYSLGGNAASIEAIAA